MKIRSEIRADRERSTIGPTRGRAGIRSVIGRTSRGVRTVRPTEYRRNLPRSSYTQTRDTRQSINRRSFMLLILYRYSYIGTRSRINRINNTSRTRTNHGLAGPPGVVTYTMTLYRPHTPTDVSNGGRDASHSQTVATRVEPSLRPERG